MKISQRISQLSLLLLLAACASEPPAADIALEKLYFPAAKAAEPPASTAVNEPAKITYGTLTFADGSHYQGQLVNGVCDGEGVLTQASGHVFTGLFIHNNAVEGTYRLANGETHIGHFVDFRLQGEGVKILADGTHIRARFQQGKIQGEAVVTPKDSNKQDAFQIWKNEQLVYAAPGPNTITKLQNQDRCEMLETGNDNGYWVHALGKCRRGLAHGLTYVVSNNSHELIEGEFNNGRLEQGVKFSYLPYDGGYIQTTAGPFNHFTINGVGQRYLNKQLVYVGEFVADEYHGLGSAYDADGNIIYQGNFANGERDGEGTCLYQGQQEPCMYHNGVRVDEIHIMRTTAQQQRLNLPMAGSIIEPVVKPIQSPHSLYPLPELQVSIPWSVVRPIPNYQDTLNVDAQIGSPVALMEKTGASCSAAIFLTPNDPQAGLVMVELIHRLKVQHNKTACVGGYLDKQLYSYLFRCENGQWQYLKRIVEPDNADMLNCYLNGYVTHYPAK